MAKVQSKEHSTGQKLKENNDQTQSSRSKKENLHVTSIFAKDKNADKPVTHDNLKPKRSVSTLKAKSDPVPGAVKRSASLQTGSSICKNTVKPGSTSNVNNNNSKVPLKRNSSFKIGSTANSDNRKSNNKQNISSDNIKSNSSSSDSLRKSNLIIIEEKDVYTVPDLVNLYDNLSGQNTKSGVTHATIRQTNSFNQIKKDQSKFTDSLKTTSFCSQAINVSKDGHSPEDSGSKRLSNECKSNKNKSNLYKIQEGICNNMESKKSSLDKAGSSRASTPQKYIYSPLLGYCTCVKNNVQNKLIDVTPSSLKGLKNQSGNEDSLECEPVFLTPTKLLAVAHFPVTDTASTTLSNNEDLDRTYLSMSERISIYETLDGHISLNVGRSSSTTTKYKRTSMPIKRTNSLRKGGGEENSINKMAKHFTGLLYQNFYQDKSSSKTSHSYENFQEKEDKENHTDKNKTFDGIKDSNTVTSNTITITVSVDEKSSSVKELNRSSSNSLDSDEWSSPSSGYEENIKNENLELQVKNNNLSVEKSRKTPSPTHKSSLSSFMSSDVCTGKDWCEDPRVISSGIVDGLSSKMRLFYRAKFEVLVSEVSYFRSLLILEMHFALSYPLRDTMSKAEYNYLFSKLFPVRAVSEKALHLLTDCFEKDLCMPHMASRIIKELSSDEFKSTYINYCKHYNLAQETLKKLNQNNKFTKVLSSLEASPVCQNLPLNSFLILPIQRITKLPLLFESILLKVPLGMKEEFESWSNAFDIFKEVAQECNTACAKEEELGLRMISLTHVVNKLSFAVGVPPIGLVVPNRFFLMENSFSIQLLNQKQRETIHLFLFNDYLFFTNPLSGGKFAIAGYSTRKQTSMKNLVDNNNPDNLSVLLSMIYDYKAESPRMFQILICKSIEIKQKWLNALPDPAL